MNKQIPRIPTGRKPSRLATALSIPLGIAASSGFVAFVIWLSTVIAGRPDLVTFRECVGIAFGLLMLRTVLAAFSQLDSKRRDDQFRR